MVLVPGSAVSAAFYSYTGQFPPLYYKAGEGTLNLASVNAGNSNGLCVGLGGINAGFYTELTKAGQSGANLDPQPEQGGQKPCSALPTTLDDYQGRHQNLLAKAGTALTAFETYSNTNPNAFSFVNGTKVNAASGWYEGVCFADVFDPSLCPAGNSKNMAMLYVAPPYGNNYTQKADFLAAIQATAFNMIVTVAGYNAIAAQNGQPAIESLRNCLYSSNNYGKAGVTNDEVARAIFAGLAAGLQKNPNSGLKELQFPVNPGGNPLFDAVQADLTQGQPTRDAPNPVRNGGVIAMMADSDDDDNDSDSDDDDSSSSVEMDYLGRGADPDGEQVDNMPSQNAAQAAQNAAAADNALIRGNRTPNDYGPIPEWLFKPSGTAWTQASREEVVQGVEIVYDRFIASGDRNDLPAPQASDTPVLREAKTARLQLDAVKAAFNDALATEDLPTAAAGRKAARAAAKAARQAATNARKLAPRESPIDLDDNDEDPAKVEGREYADQAEQFANGAEFIADQIENYVDNLKREAAKLRSPKKRVAAVVILVLSLIGFVGGLIWTFLFGYGRSLGIGAFRFGAKDLSVKAPDTGTTTTVDVLTVLADAEGQAKLEFIQAVHLVDDNGNTVDSLGSWSTSGLNIVYTSAAGPRAPVSVKYVLEAVGPIAPATTPPATLTISFVPVVMDAKNPVDIAVAAKDRTSAVSVGVPDDFLLDAQDEDGVWSYDKTSGQATYTPNASAKIVEPLKAASFKLLPMGNPAKLVVLFPPVALSAGGNRNVGFAFPAVATANDGVTASISFGDTGPISATADATADVNGTSEIVGTWSLTGEANNVIVFTPNTKLTDMVLTLDPVSYTLVYAGIRSAAAKATLTLPAPGKPVAQDAVKVTANRSNKVSFAALGAVLQGTTSDANGSWSVNKAAGTVEFSPATSLAAAETTVSVSYILKSTTGQSAPAKFSITFLPAPVDLTVQNVSRIMGASSDVGGSVTIASDYALNLWDGTKAVQFLPDTATGGSWVIDEKQIAFRVPRNQAKPVGMRDVVPFTNATSSSQVKYVFTAKDGTSDKPGTVTFNFDTVTPVAYSFDMSVTTLKPSVSISLKDHIYVPNGIKAVYVGSATLSLTTFDLRDSNKNIIGTVAVDASSISTAPRITLTPAKDSTATSYVVPYRIVDTKNTADNMRNDSNVGRVTVTLAAVARPQLRNFLLSTDVTAGKSIAADVLTNAESLFPPDPKSVVFTGLNDINGVGLPADAMLKLDGKAIAVPGEGTWMVSDSNKILFMAEAGLAAPPTPALVQYADVKGNVSNEATVVIDPSLATLSTLNKTLPTDDTAFWTSFQKHVVLASPPLTADEFITTTAALSGAVFAAAGKVGANPVKESDFQTAFDQWVAAGQPWDPADGDGTNDVMALCSATVAQAMPANSSPYLQRYWTLDAISRMLARALPDGDGANGAPNP